MWFIGGTRKSVHSIWLHYSDINLSGSVSVVVMHKLQINCKSRRHLICDRYWMGEIVIHVPCSVRYRMPQILSNLLRFLVHCHNFWKLKKKLLMCCSYCQHILNPMNLYFQWTGINKYIQFLASHYTRINIYDFLHIWFSRTVYTLLPMLFKISIILR